KTASPGLASPCSFEPLGLSGVTVTVCRESYQNRCRTSSQFLQKSEEIFHIFRKCLKIQRNKI
ncbi:MAG: hypothetical protein IKL98_05765, partial [Akkermansia sp.]|nr:hypothetical protein [Akkermansia sp.]